MLPPHDLPCCSFKFQDNPTLKNNQILWYSDIVNTSKSSPYNDTHSLWSFFIRFYICQEPSCTFQLPMSAFTWAVVHARDVICGRAPSPTFKPRSALMSQETRLAKNGPLMMVWYCIANNDINLCQLIFLGRTFWYYEKFKIHIIVTLVLPSVDF